MKLEHVRLNESFILLGISALYLFLFQFLIGLGSEHIFLVSLCIVLYFVHPAGRKFVFAYAFFILYWFIWDGMKAFPNYNYHEVQIEQLYQAELNLFGIHHDGQWITPNVYLRLHASNLKTVLAGLCYINWVPVPLAFGFYLFRTKPALFLRFSLCFLISNLIGFVIYYVYPAAPPWYVNMHGFHFIQDTPGNAAGLLEFDKYFNIQLFENLYKKSSNVFAAFPSLHASYPLIVLIYGLKAGMKYWNILFALFCIGIWWAAIYTQHHYLLDVIAGIFCAICGFLILDRILVRNKFISGLLSKYESAIRLS